MTVPAVIPHGYLQNNCRKKLAVCRKNAERNWFLAEILASEFKKGMNDLRKDLRKKLGEVLEI